MTQKQRAEFAQQHGMDIVFVNYFFDTYDIGEFATMQMLYKCWQRATQEAYEKCLKSMGMLGT